MVTAERFAQGLTVGDYVAQMITNRETFARLLAAPAAPLAGPPLTRGAA